MVPVFFCPEKITNKDLYKKAGMMPVSDMITDRCWRWLGHGVRLENINNAKVSQTWSPEGRRRGKPKTTWHRRGESELRRLSFTSMDTLKMWQNTVQGGKSWGVASHPPS